MYGFTVSFACPDIATNLAEKAEKAKSYAEGAHVIKMLDRCMSELNEIEEFTST